MMRMLLGVLALTAVAAQPSPAAHRPWKGTPHIIPGTIEAEDFDEGGEGVAFHDLDPENQEKRRPVYRDGGVDLEWRAAASQQYNLGWTRAGEWIIYSVDVRESGIYRVEMLVASAKAGGTFHLAFDGVNRTGPITIPDTGGWQRLAPLVKNDVRLEAGRYAMKMVMETDGPSGSIGDIDYFRFVLVKRLND
jgi:Carbohydrate binding module (family 6)